MFVLPRLSELIPWSLWDYLPKTAMGTDVFIIGGNPFQYRAYSAWHVKPFGTHEHTREFRVKRAICLNELDELAIALDEGFDLESIVDENYGYTALTLAAAINKSNIVSYLLLRGAKIEGRDKKGQTALMRATTMWQLDTILTLLSNGANIFEKDKFGYNCLEKAHMRGLNAIEKLLNDNYKPNYKPKLPKSILRFKYEKEFEDNAFEISSKKKHFKGKFTPYPFNDIEGNYKVSFSFE